MVLTIRDPNKIPSGRYSLGRVVVRMLFVFVVLFLIAGKPAALLLRRYFPGVGTIHLLVAVAVVCGALAVVAEAFWRGLYKASPSDFCHHCGYDLTLDESGVCPECGSPIPDPNGECPPQSKSSGTH